MSAAAKVEQLAINTIRTLSMDGVEAANSGHPGTPMALAPAAYLLYAETMRYDPADPGWLARDRFILSCGHASMLLYSMLHLTGVKQLDKQGRPMDELAVPLDHIRNFRQLRSRCPGHPEYRHTSGVECTTGPLGQGVGNSVGMAIGMRWLAARYNKPGFELFDARVYALCSDGDLMEGISGEAASLAGHLRLANLCWIYDDNGITIEGHTSLAFSEDVAGRFASYGWNVLRVADINDLAAMRQALAEARRSDRPTLVIVRSVIAWGAPNKANTHGAHGAPLGPDEVRLTKKAYGWAEDAQFVVPAEVAAHFAEAAGCRGAQAHREWNELFGRYARQYPAEAAEIGQIDRRELPAGWDAAIAPFAADPKGVASRASSGKVLNQLAKNVPWLLGGSADLAPSNNTLLNFAPVGDFSADNPGGRNFHFGIREHAMGAICNGMTLCGLRAYGATFFVFSDYMRPSIRLAALMQLPTIFIFTHDSIGVGEDGPTHQPVEHLAALRAMPGLIVLRPGDANEVAEAYRAVMNLTTTPACLVLTRQNLPTLDRSKYASAEGVQRGGYILADAAGGKPQVILMGTGSELSLVAAAYEELTAAGIAARAVSLPSWELFESQPQEYRDAVLPPAVTARVAIEAGVEQGWQRYLGCRGVFLGMRTFGDSAPAGTLFKHYGLTSAAVAAAARKLLEG